ncbi:MAG: tail fiber domain-containing protein, partial [Methylophagaceae bacterium]
EAHNYYYQYSGGWAWDGNETGNRSQPYTSYDFKSQGSSQMVIYNNNVGIGTTSPGVKLTILSTYAAGPTLGSSTVGGQALLGENGLFGQYSGVNSSNGDVWHQVQRNDTATSYNMHLQPAGGNVTMGANVIVANGLLGIGTTTLSNRLSVGGSGQNWDTSPAIKMWDSYNSKGWYVGSANNNTIGDFYIRSVTAENLYPVAADQQFTIKQSGNVGIGTISPSHKLDVAGDIRLQNDNQIYFGSTGSIPYWTAGVDNTTNNNFVIGGVSYNTGDRDILLNPVGNGNVGIKTTSPSYELDVVGDIRARGNGTGNIYVGTYGGRLSNYYNSITTSAEFRVGYAGGTYAICRASAFTVTSDYRLKEKIVPLTDSLDRLGQLNVYKFNWIDKPNEEPVDGFIAHEVAEVIPEAVVGVKDEIGPDGKPEYQGLDQAKIVPLLTAALQQAIDKIEALEVRINKLENK